MLEKRKRERGLSKEEVVLSEAFRRSRETTDGQYASTLFQIVRTNSEKFQKKKDRFIGTVVSFAGIAVLKSLTSLPEGAQQALASNRDLFILVSTIFLCSAVYEGGYWALLKSELRRPIKSIRELCELLGLSEVHIPTVFQIVSKEMTRRYATVNPFAPPSTVPGRLILSDDNSDTESDDDWTDAPGYFDRDSE